jgi:hypothetical protein
LLFLSLSQQRLFSSERSAGHGEPVLQRSSEEEEEKSDVLSFVLVHSRTLKIHIK